MYTYYIGNGRLQKKRNKQRKSKGILTETKKQTNYTSLYQLFFTGNVADRIYGLDPAIIYIYIKLNYIRLFCMCELIIYYPRVRVVRRTYFHSVACVTRKQRVQRYNMYIYIYKSVLRREEKGSMESYFPSLCSLFLNSKPRPERIGFTIACACVFSLIFVYYFDAISSRRNASIHKAIMLRVRFSKTTERMLKEKFCRFFSGFPMQFMKNEFEFVTKCGLIWVFI